MTNYTRFRKSDGGTRNGSASWHIRNALGGLFFACWLIGFDAAARADALYSVQIPAPATFDSEC